MNRHINKTHNRTSLNGKSLKDTQIKIMTYETLQKKQNRKEDKEQNFTVTDYVFTEIIHITGSKSSLA